MFNDLLNWCLKNWEILLSVLLFIASVVIAILRKKPVLNGMAVYLTQLFEKIPVFINLVEKEGHGTEKKLIVLELCKEFLIENFGFYDFDLVKSLISDYIETVLTTPQKKEVN